MLLTEPSISPTTWPKETLTTKRIENLEAFCLIGDNSVCYFFFFCMIKSCGWHSLHGKHFHGVEKQRKTKERDFDLNILPAQKVGLALTPFFAWAENPIPLVFLFSPTPWMGRLWLTDLCYDCCFHVTTCLSNTPNNLIQNVWEDKNME